MKNKLVKSGFKTIFKTRRRFLSILLMALLGVGFYAGLKASAPDMQEMIDKYYDDTNTYDISVVSNLGLTDEDVAETKKQGGVKDVYPIKQKDAEIKNDTDTYVGMFIEYDENINTPKLIEGRLPENENECLMDPCKLFNNKRNYNIGDIVEIEDPDNNFNVKKLTVVGKADSSLYISNTRGNTSLGTGSINFYIYVYKGEINLDCYTNMYITANGAKELETNTSKYKEIVENTKSNIEDIKEDREKARYDKLVLDATNKLNDAKEEFNSNKQEAENKIQDAENKIADGKKEIEQNESKLKQSESELNKNEEGAKKKFQDAENKIKAAESKIKEKETEINNGKKELETKKQENAPNIQLINDNIVKANNLISELEEKKQMLVSNGLDTTEIDKGMQDTNNILIDLETKKAYIESSLAEAENKILSGENELNNAKKEIESQKSALAITKKQTNTKLANARAEIENGKKKLEDAKQEIADNEQKLEDSKKEMNEKLSDAQKKLDDAQEQINKIEKVTWYIQDRLGNAGYESITESIGSMKNISKVFPVIFYLIAILTSLTTMTRMVEEERTEMGTLKAIGYRNGQILFKYMLYAFLATAIGGILGMLIGFKIIPNIVWIMYSLLYIVPDFDAKYRILEGSIGLIIAFICICGATYYTVYKDLKNMPASLMRPKAPKSGRRVFLEKITFIWKKLKFSNKVTIRNLFRYKKRALMTIIGIAGCTALILVGFGLKDSISKIADNQFGKVFTYNLSIYVDENKDLSSINNKIDTNNAIDTKVNVNMQTGKVRQDYTEKNVNVLVTEDSNEFDNVTNLIEASNKNKKVSLDDEGIIITEKLAKTLNINIGDTVTLVLSDDIPYEFKVKDIVINYVDHYVYMSKNLYESKVKQYKTNEYLLKTVNLNSDEQNDLATELLNTDNVLYVLRVSETLKVVSDMLGSLNYVVLILIVSSAILAFVVLYNLSNINIGERKREIATLKVLGFYDKEVDSYINKENIIFTIIGIIVGLICGYFLLGYVLTTCEIERLRFVRDISPISYVYAAVITSIFSLIVSKIVHYNLKKIDMIESLKSVE